MIAQLKKEYHQKAFAFSHSYIAHKNKGKFGVFVVHHFDNVSLPDYDQLLGVYDCSFHAHAMARFFSATRQICTTVEQI